MKRRGSYGLGLDLAWIAPGLFSGEGYRGHCVDRVRSGIGYQIFLVLIYQMSFILSLTRNGGTHRHMKRFGIASESQSKDEPD